MWKSEDEMLLQYNGAEFDQEDEPEYDPRQDEDLAYESWVDNKLNGLLF